MSDQTVSDPIRILIADAHPLLRAGLQATLTQETDFIVAGEAETDAETQYLCQALQPDVVLLALNLPGPAVTETVTTLREKYTAAKLIILTAQQDEATIWRMVNSGIDGYILKDEAPQTVVQAIRMVLLGGKWFSDAIVKTLTRPVDDENENVLPPQEAGLTQREWQLLDLLAQGRDNVQIAAELSLADQTVRNYLSRLYQKLGVETRSAAILWALNHGLDERLGRGEGVTGCPATPLPSFSLFPTPTPFHPPVKKVQMYSVCLKF